MVIIYLFEDVAVSVHIHDILPDRVAHDRGPAASGQAHHHRPLSLLGHASNDDLGENTLGVDNPGKHVLRYFAFLAFFKRKDILVVCFLPEGLVQVAAGHHPGHLGVPGVSGLTLLLDLKCLVFVGSAEEECDGA